MVFIDCSQNSKMILAAKNPYVHIVEKVSLLAIAAAAAGSLRV